MLFWLLAALLTFSACLAVLYPVFKRDIGTASESEHDLEVYRDQLAEVDRDVARGTIDATQAEQARAEIGRRILKAGTLAEKARAPSGMTALAKSLVTASVLAVPLVSWGFYGAIGSPDLPAQPLHSRTDPGEQTVDELVAQAERHLAANPTDGRGWDILAPIYLRMGRYGEAVTAYRNAISLEGENAQRHVGLAEALVSSAGGTITSEAEEQLEQALALEPQNVSARHLTAIGRAQEGELAEASALWNAVLDDLPADSPWRGVIDQALVRAHDMQRAERPDQGNGQAATDDGAAQQDEAIEDMVAGLDARLRDEPDDLEGWLRLMRSYAVLERDDDATDAYRRGLEAFEDDGEASAQLTAQARTLGIETVDE